MFMSFSNKTHINNKENQNPPPTLKHNIILNIEIKERSKRE